MRSSIIFSLAAAVRAALACDSCYGPASAVVHERHVRRMQPEASNATSGPKAPLEWGQLNFLHTVSQIYGHMTKFKGLTFPRPIPMGGLKDISRSRPMVLIGATSFRSRDTCSIWLAIWVLISCWLTLVWKPLPDCLILGRKLTYLNQGDLHDGNGLSDAALPDGVLSNPIFDEIEYDVLTIGKFIVELCLNLLTEFRQPRAVSD